MAPLNVGIIGYGFSAKVFHLPFIVPNADLKIYAFLQRADAPDSTSEVEAGKHCTRDYPDAKHFQSSGDFFHDANIDLVVVCSHIDTHIQFAGKALMAGKHVVVEKPFAATSAEADQLIARSKKSGKILTVFQNRRYDSDFLTLRHLVQQNAFGPITDCTIEYDMNFPFWMQGMSADYKPGDGLMYGLGTHSIDQALLLFGRPDKVTGFLRSLRGVESENDDTFMIILQYANQPAGHDSESKSKTRSGGLWVEIKTSCVAPMPHPPKTQIRGYDGSFIKYGSDTQELQIMDQGMKATDAGFGVEDPDTYGLLTTKAKIHDDQILDKQSGQYVGKFPSFKGEYTAFYADLVKAIRGEQDLYVKPEQSRDGIRLIEIARESAAKGVTLPWS